MKKILGALVLLVFASTAHTATRTAIMKQEEAISETAVQQRASDPGSPVDGQKWINTTSGLFKYRHSGSTYSIGGGGASAFDAFSLIGGVTITDDNFDGIRMAETGESVTSVYCALRDSGTSGNTVVKINYGPSLASNTTISIAANGGINYATSTPSITLSANDFISLEVTSVAAGAPENLFCKINY